jgi:hypothetical protein
MELIRQILPYLLVFFFLYKGNKQLLFLLGIPFLMFMSNSIFFENAKPFHIPGFLYGLLPLVWLFLLWICSNIFSKNKFSKEISNNRSNITDFLIIGLIIISVLGLFRTVFDYYPMITGVINEFFIMTSLLLAYFIIKNWISSNESEVVIEFLYTVVVINSIAALLFLLHQGLHFNIYTLEEYLSESFEGQEITRSFWFMPQFLFFSVAFLLVFKNKYSFSIVLLIVNLAAIIITYTISAIVIAIIILLLYFVLTGLKKRKLGPAFGNLIKYTIVAIAGFFIMLKLLPANINYLLSRISEHTESQYTLKESNDIDVRLANTKLMISKIERDKKLLGMGPITDEQSPKVIEMKGNTADIAWSGVIFYWGFIGLSVFVLIFLFSSIQAFNFYIKFEGTTSDLALLLLLYIISQFIDSFVSWTFLSGHGIAIGLWYFALLSALPKIHNNDKFIESKKTLTPIYSK